MAEKKSLPRKHLKSKGRGRSSLEGGCGQDCLIPHTFWHARHHPWVVGQDCILRADFQPVLVELFTSDSGGLPTRRTPGYPCQSARIAASRNEWWRFSAVVGGASKGGRRISNPSQDTILPHVATRNSSRPRWARWGASCAADRALGLLRPYYTGAYAANLVVLVGRRRGAIRAEHQDRASRRQPGPRL